MLATSEFWQQGGMHKAGKDLEMIILQEKVFSNKVFSVSSMEMKEVYCRVSPSISPYYGFVHSGKSIPMSVLRNPPVQLLCFVDKETENQRENVSCSSHMVKSVAEQKLELRIRASSYFHILSLHSLVLLPQRGRKTSSAGELCPSLFFSQPFCFSLGCRAPAPRSAWSEFKP